MVLADLIITRQTTSNNIKSRVPITWFNTIGPAILKKDIISFFGWPGNIFFVLSDVDLSDVS